jgi:hypothetical protein
MFTKHRGFERLREYRSNRWLGVWLKGVFSCNYYLFIEGRSIVMCRKLIVVVSALCLCLIASASAATIVWDFEDGDDHRFNLWSAYAPVFASDDPCRAGDEALTGCGGTWGLPDAGLAWTVGRPDEFEGLIPAIDDAGNCHIEGGLLKYGPCNDPFGADVVKGWLNTYALTMWGDRLHNANNDQIASSPTVLLGASSEMTIRSLGGGSGTKAPEYHPNPALVWTEIYDDNSSGVVVLDANSFEILVSVHCNGKSGPVDVDVVDLSAHAGKEVIIEVVDAFEGSWGWLAIDEIIITDAIQRPPAAIIVQQTDGENTWGFDQAQIDRLTDVLGYDVTVVPMGDLSSGAWGIADANDMDVILISESIGSSAADPLIGTSTPVMHEEAYGWDNWLFMGPRTNIHWEGGVTHWEVVNDTHPIMVDAGISLGLFHFVAHPDGDNFTTELVDMMAPGAELLAKVNPDGNDYALAWAMEKGAELYDGNAVSSRSVGFSLSGQSGVIDANRLTDEAWGWFDACLRWLDPPPAAGMVVSDPNLTAGFDQAQYDRLVSLGYEVTVATGADVADGTFSVDTAEALDVIVVSESIGSSQANNLIGANVPMMHQESYGWSRHYFTSGLQKTWTVIDGAVDVVDDTHAICVNAGISAGSLGFLTDPNVAVTTDLVAALAPGAVNIAQATNADGNDVAVVFAIEAGGELADPNMVAASRVVGFSLPGQAALDASVMTDDAWAFFDAAIAWLDDAD